MNREALFCDGTQDYVIPAESEENEKVILRFRTAHNDVEEVKILVGNRSHSMWRAKSTDEFDYYEIECQLGTEPFKYSFRSRKASRSVISTDAESLITGRIITRSSLFPGSPRRPGRKGL